MVALNRKDAGVGFSVLAIVGSIALAGYLLFTEVTTLPGTSRPATGLESGNPFIYFLAVLPVALSVGGLLGVYHDRPWALAVGGGLLLLFGLIGINVGLFYLPIGVALLLGYILTVL